MTIELADAPRIYNDAKGLDCKGGLTLYAYGGDGRDYVSVNWTARSIDCGVCITPAEARKFADMLIGAADLAEGLAVTPPEGKE